MRSFIEKVNNFILITLLTGPSTVLIVLIIFIGLIKDCIVDTIDPLDDSINKTKKIVTRLRVVDNKDNGFRVVYVTAESVTQERLEEIRSRKPILQSFERLKHDAPLHWGGSLLNADICEFALFARKYNVDDDIYIHNIFVCGIDKMNLYVQPNPNLPDCATWMNHDIEQGNQYLNSDDINYYIPSGKKIYRYWKCNILRQVSDTDERFSHFTEKERLR